MTPPDGSPLRHQRLTDDELKTVQLLHRAIKPYDPLTAAFLIYPTGPGPSPIYDALVAESGVDPASDVTSFVRLIRRYVETRYDEMEVPQHAR